MAAGFENYRHAQRAFGEKRANTQRGFDLYISVLWRDRATSSMGCEILKMRLGKPLDALVKPAQYKNGLAAMRREGPDHLADLYTEPSQADARETACKIARKIQFMEATGLVPSGANRSFPKGSFQNRMPGSDHDAGWYDPVSKGFIRTSEPYSRGGVTPEQHKWAARYGWGVVKAPWKGMYRPDDGTSLFLLADLSKGYSLEPLISRLADAPPPIVISGWQGESRPTAPAFVSPGRMAEIAAKARKAKTVGNRARPIDSTEDNSLLSEARRWPNARMPIEQHKAVGRLLKSVLIGTRGRAGVHRRIEAMRVELDSKAGREYGRDELSDDVFFNLYYQELPESDPLAAVPGSWQRHIASLGEIKATLARHYPECPQLRKLLKKADQAIASLLTWKVAPAAGDKPKPQQSVPPPM
ncbi:hypothetical protein BRAO375_960051 [Bradyrhizobium sp. ORS 375]|nr:hypothetical protein BRAO375_960051 [Bradyrhizobium sp. ORS 375]